METLKINGVDREFESGQMPATLAALLKLLNIEAATIVAEVDGCIVKREIFGDTRLRSGQKIELIRFVGGG